MSLKENLNKYLKENNLLDKEGFINLYHLDPDDKFYITNYLLEHASYGMTLEEVMDVIYENFEPYEEMYNERDDIIYDFIESYGGDETEVRELLDDYINYYPKRSDIEEILNCTELKIAFILDRGDANQEGVPNNKLADYLISYSCEELKEDCEEDLEFSSLNWVINFYGCKIDYLYEAIRGRNSLPLNREKDYYFLKDLGIIINNNHYESLSDVVIVTRISLKDLLSYIISKDTSKFFEEFKELSGKKIIISKNSELNIGDIYYGKGFESDNILLPYNLEVPIESIKDFIIYRVDGVSLIDHHDFKHFYKAVTEYGPYLDCHYIVDKRTQELSIFKEV